METDPTDLSFLTGISEYMKGSIEYVSVEKDHIKTLVNVINFQGQAIQEMGWLIDKIIEAMKQIAVSFDGESKKKIDQAIVSYDTYYDEILTFLLKELQANGFDLNRALEERQDKDPEKVEI